MPLRPPAGFISAFYDPLRNPNAPTIGTATGGDASASVAFTPPSDVGGSAITGYGAISTPGNVTATAASSPISVTGLTNGTAYTFAVWAINTYGPSAFSGASNSVSPSAILGLFAGGENNSGDSSIIDYVSISSTGNATDFGDLSNTIPKLAGCASSVRGLFGGGVLGNYTNIINYVTIASVGNSTDFGDLTIGRGGLAACSNSTRGIFAGGLDAGSGAESNVIDYVTIATTGNATDFGDLLTVMSGQCGCASPTRGVFGGGYNGTSYTNVIQYVTIASTGNATDFGDLSNIGKTNSASCSSSTRGLFAGGFGSPGYTGGSSLIDYITIATTGNATNFGNLTNNFYGMAGCSSSTRGLIGGDRRTAYSNVIEYVTIAATGNATDFGDLTAPRGFLAACSNAHGGI
jgi:hypothetical protein